MLSYRIEDELTKRLKALQSSFDIKFAALQSLSEEELQFIHRFARISMIGASTRIENAVLTDSEISWIDTILSEDGKTTSFQKNLSFIENKLSKDRERSIEEVAGCRAMLGIIYEQAKQMVPFSETHLRGLHQELLQFYPKASHYRGRYKSNPNSVIEQNHTTGEKRNVLITADPGPATDAAMKELIDWYRESIGHEVWPVAVACEFVFRFLAIHPFQDGNGRLGRGLFLLALLQSPDESIASVSRYLAIDRHIEKHKEDYYLVLHRCSNGKFKQDPSKYRIDLFLNFMIKVLMDAFKDIDHNRVKFRAFKDLAPAARKVLECFKDEPESRLRMAELSEKTSLPRRTVLNAIQVLLEDGFIQKYGKGAGVRYQIVF